MRWQSLVKKYCFHLFTYKFESLYLPFNILTKIKPPRRAVLSKQSISRVLFCLHSGDYLSRPIIAYRLKRHNPKGRRATLIPSLFGLAPDGVYRANILLYCWCALTDTVPPLPQKRRFTFLWHYSLWSPTPDVIRHPALWSSDFPRTYARNHLSYLLLKV